MKKIALFLGFLMIWVSSQASEMIPIQYQSVNPVSKALKVRFADARIGVYCVYRTQDEKDSLLVRQFAQQLRSFCLESPAIPVMKIANFGMFPLPVGQELVSRQTIKDLAAADTLDYIFVVDRFSIKISQLLFLQYQVDYRLYTVSNDTILSSVEVKKLAWIPDENNDNEMISVVADYFANVIMPYWETQHRNLYQGYGNDAKLALTAAQNFRWKDALAIWMKLSTVPNDQTAAEMYYNIAVGLEAMGEYDLALKWINQSMTVLNLDEDQKELKNQILKKNQMQGLINQQLK